MSAPSGLSRRKLLSGSLRREPAPLRPPWTDEAGIHDACTACGACVEACPQGILSAGSDGRPVLSLDENECIFCGACAEACPEPVFAPRGSRPFDHVASIGPACVAAAGVHCQSCGDVCPEAAITFRPRLGGPPLPRLSEISCTGCGACLAACPADVITVRPLEAAHE